MARDSVCVSVAVFVLFSAVPARGQTRLFGEASALFDHDPTAFGPGGTAAAVGLSIGITMKESYSLRFNVELPRLHELTLSSTSTLGPDTISSRTTTESTRTIAYSILAGRYFQVSRSVNVGISYGGSLTNRPSRRVGFEDVSTRDGTLVQHSPFDVNFSDKALAVTFGIETAIAITRHVYLVPSLRVHYYLPVFQDDYQSPFITRGGVGARWRF